jgi:hypothetical protein
LRFGLRKLGGYEDDEDYGDLIVYTGAGGRDPDNGVQIKDQELTHWNLALAVSWIEGLPVRVLRGEHGDPAFSPVSGYRYDGLYAVTDSWRATDDDRISSHSPTPGDSSSQWGIYRYRILAPRVRRAFRVTGYFTECSGHSRDRTDRSRRRLARCSVRTIATIERSASLARCCPVAGGSGLEPADERPDATSQICAHAAPPMCKDSGFQRTVADRRKSRTDYR